MMTALAFNQLKQPTLSGNFIADDFLGWTFLKLLLICLPGKNISETSSDGNKKKKFSWESGESCAFKKCRETPILKPESKILHLNKEGTSLCHTCFFGGRSSCYKFVWTYFFPIHPFSAPWKHEKTVSFSDIFGR